MERNETLKKKLNFKTLQSYLPAEIRVITTNRYLLIISSLDGKQKNPSLDLLQNSYIEKERKQLRTSPAIAKKFDSFDLMMTGKRTQARSVNVPCKP